MMWRTKEGHSYTLLVECYGRLIDSAGEEWKDVCEARTILRVPLESRARHMEMIAKKRGRGDPKIEAVILAGLKASVTKEWQWLRDQKAKAGAAA